MIAVTRIGVMPGPLVATLMAGMIVAPGLSGQEVESLPNARAAEGPQFGVLVGLRGDLVGVPSPGASLDLVLDSPEGPIWMSLQFLAQMIRWNVQGDPRTRRDHIFVGRFRLGHGARWGPRFYGLFEKGIGVIMTEPAPSRGDTYDLAGFGVGGEETDGRFTVSLELVIGVANRSTPWFYGHGGVAVQYRLPRLHLGKRGQHRSSP